MYTILQSDHTVSISSISVGASLHHLTGSRDLAKCFGIFAVIHRMIKTSETLTRIIREVLDDFMADNVIYLELRSTPRDLEGRPHISLSVQNIVKLIYFQCHFLHRWDDSMGVCQSIDHRDRGAQQIARSQDDSETSPKFRSLEKSSAKY